ncbi:unnamed protein product [Ixodes pacificus]
MHCHHSPCFSLLDKKYAFCLLSVSCWPVLYILSPQMMLFFLFFTRDDLFTLYQVCCCSTFIDKTFTLA